MVSVAYLLLYNLVFRQSVQKYPGFKKDYERFKYSNTKFKFVLLSNFLRISAFLVDRTIIKAIEVIDLFGDSRVTADCTLQLFSQVKLQLHFAAIEIDNASALTVYTHLSC